MKLSPALLLLLAACARPAPTDAEVAAVCHYSDDNIAVYQASIDEIYANNPHLYQLARQVADEKITSKEAGAQLTPHEFTLSAVVVKLINQRNAAQQHVDFLNANCRAANF